LLEAVTYGPPVSSQLAFVIYLVVDHRKFKLLKVKMSSIGTTIYGDPFSYDEIHSIEKNGQDLEFYARLALGKNVLEVGCGSGRYTIPLVLRGIEITVMDLSQIKMAKKFCLKNRPTMKASLKLVKSSGIIRCTRDSC
jgi:2-polyprenyl-3-methyl-5-hydroxy-6-metoxy-1,4-benzoquinol methylase